MDIEIETKFVKTFIEKRMQDRFILELSTELREGKYRKGRCRRFTAFDRFSDGAEKYLKPQCIYLKNNYARKE
jgi:hypothetical protein